MCDQCDRHRLYDREMTWTEFMIGLVSVLIVVAIVVFLTAVGVGLL